MAKPVEGSAVRSILVYVTSDVDNALGENVLKLPLLLALSEALPVRPPRLVDKLLGLAAAAAGYPIGVPNPIPLPQAWRDRAAALLPPGACYVGLSPGAGNQGTGKCWPLDAFIAAARVQAERGR